jgi:hypothetical protein
LRQAFGSYLEVFGQVTMGTQLEPRTETASGITQESGYNFTARTVFTNDGNATAYAVNVTHLEDPQGSLVYNDTRRDCGEVAAGGTCNWTFTVTVPNSTSPGLIDTTVNVSWRNPDRTFDWNQNTSEITVSSNPEPRIEALRINDSRVT